MRLIDLDAIMAQFPKADFYGDAIENMKAYPHWRTDITGLINILEAVPIIERSEDCISRKAVLDKFAEVSNISKRPYHDMWEYVEKMPHVIPQQKIGRWMSHYDYCKKHELLPSGLVAMWWCDQCEQGVEHPTSFCPKCGAKMEVEK